MDTATLIELLKQAPPLALMVLVVVIFLKYLSGRDKTFTTVIEKVSAEHLEARRASRETIERCSTALERNAETRVEMSGYLGRLSQALDRRENSNKHNNQH